MTSRNPDTTSRRLAGIVLLSALTLLSACGGDDRPPPKAAEEELTDEADVPEVVRAKARQTLETIDPEASCSEWFWDREDAVWECSAGGVARTTEVDIDPNGVFSELEFDLTPDEVVETMPSVAELVTETCGGLSDARIELSVRRIDLLGRGMAAEALWGEEGVFVEFQCADAGDDYEIDAFGALASKSDDDEERTR